ncbi:MAG: S-layer homology domain-containing protein [Clostridia bacterium]|nr:S-layer homology domain-containing protein [Clostridia bacterium]
MMPFKLSVKHFLSAILAAAILTGCGGNSMENKNTNELKTYLLGKIDISASGKGCRMWLGDIDGDGRMEFVMVQPDTGFDDRYFPHSVVCATAYNLEGEMLWQIGKPDPNVTGSGSDIPAQIYDIDNDGNNEFLCVMNDQFCVFDGKTGTLKKKYPIPDQHAHDCIILADLEGKGYAGNVILKNRYHQLWALDSDFNVMWTFKGNIGHYPWPYDLDGDGKEELIAGYTVLNGKGETLWTIPMDDHADCIWVGDLDQDPTTGPAVLVGGRDTTAHTWDGKLIWRFTDTVESQNIAMGDFRPEIKGTEIGGLDRIDRSGPDGKDGLFLVDSQGNSLYKEDRKVPGWSTIATTIHNFDGKGSDHLLAYRRSGLPAAIYDGYMNPVFTFPFDGHVMWTDLIGDGQSQILIYSDDEVQIFSASETDLSKATVPYTRPQPKRLYNWTRYWGSEMDPARYAVNYITGDFTNSDVFAWAQKYAQSSPSDASDEIKRADFAVLLVNALNLHAYETKNFADIKKTDYFYDAVGILKKLGIAQASDNLFKPKDTITAGDAADMAAKASGKSISVQDMNSGLTKGEAAKIIMALK